MKTFSSKDEMYKFSSAARAEGKTVGVVPTMGALHEGHLALMRKARKECGVVIATIFVNKTQFAPNEDFSRYPRTIESDKAGCEAAGVDAIFAPTTDEMYSPDFATYIVNEKAAGILEGAVRPTHFRGVLTVVMKLFNITAPHVAYFGQKDYQQTVVIRQMVNDLDIPVDIRIEPTVRERDGLAMSSRNRYLSESERKQAVCLHTSLVKCRELMMGGEKSAKNLAAAMRAVIDTQPDAKIDYVEIRNPDSLEPVDNVRPGDVALVAVRLGKTRLIDNMIL